MPEIVRICYTQEDGTATTEDLPVAEAAARQAELGPDRMLWSATLEQLPEAFRSPEP